MSDMELVGVIQQIVQNTVQTMKMADKATGTVENCQGCTGADRCTGRVTIREGLKAGEKVLMVRVQGGNQYIVLSRIT